MQGIAAKPELPFPHASSYLEARLHEVVKEIPLLMPLLRPESGAFRLGSRPCRPGLSNKGHRGEVFWGNAVKCVIYIVLPIKISSSRHNLFVALYVCQEGKLGGRSVGSAAGGPVKRAGSPFYRPDNKYTHRFLTKGQARRACPLFWKIIFRWVYT